MKNEKNTLEKGKLVWVDFGKDFSIQTEPKLPKEPVRPSIIFHEKTYKNNK